VKASAATTPHANTAIALFRPANARLRPKKSIFDHMFLAGGAALMPFPEGACRLSGRQNIIRSNAKQQFCTVCS
jgi:hypothetical protein